MKKLIFSVLALVLGTAGAQVPAPEVIEEDVSDYYHCRRQLVGNS